MTNEICILSGSGEPSAARTLASSGGKVIEVTGLALNSVASLYLMKYMTTSGTTIIEYLPHLFNSASTVTFRQHLSDNIDLTFNGFMTMVAILAGGIVVRRVGNWLSADSTIDRMEQFLYRRSSNSEDHTGGNTGRQR